MSSLYSKILQAQKAIGNIEKTGYNTNQQYKYVQEADILAQVKKAYTEAGLVVLTSTTSEVGHYPNTKGGITRWAKVILTYKVVEVETGQLETGTFDGYAEDTYDKAIYKATTGAHKYFLMKFFGVATGDDPELEEKPAQEERRVPAGRPQQKMQNRAPEKQPQKQPEKPHDPKKPLDLPTPQFWAARILRLGLPHHVVASEIDIRAAKDRGDIKALEAAFRRLSDRKSQRA